MSETSGSDKSDINQSRAAIESEENNNDAQTSNAEEVTSQTALDKKRETFDSNANVNTSEDSKTDLASFNGEVEQPKPKPETDSSNSASQRPVTVTVSSSSALSEIAPKIIAGPAQIRSTTPVIVGARVVTSNIQGPGATSLALVPQPGRVSVAVSQPRVTTLTTAKGTVVTLPRISTPSQSVPMTRTPQTVPLQLPANFQVPQGMVLIRSDSGQLMHRLRECCQNQPVPMPLL
ncbi:hypothetical protein M9458_040025 [Cirrhinus mrigala]|uniref:Uncharacterized protein n=1 Tax=Cirrhinus mrigala TaxID=683832 RepID=A0ABD0NRB7_CIRMR